MASQPMLIRPVFLLHAEGLCFFFASCGAYHLLFPHHWILFACLFLVPDLSLLLYHREPSAPASLFYNVMHNYALPALVGILAVLLHRALLGEVSLIWSAHISMDRMLGYGLKYPASFKFTHIQATGNPAFEAAGVGSQA
jgi:hypothetical protein